MSTPGTAVSVQASHSPLRLLRAELLKIWTTNAWWIFGILAVANTALTLLGSVFVANSDIDVAIKAQDEPPPDFTKPYPDGRTPDPQEVELTRQSYLAAIDLARVLTRSAANIYTSGQFFGLLFVVILGGLIVTNEFFHQTATTTFLTTPKRTSVILNKLGAAIVLAFAFWAVSAVINLAVGATFFGVKGYGPQLGDWTVIRSILMNLLAYVLWAILGVGFGVLIRSQLGTAITSAVLYLLSFPLAFAVFSLVRAFIIKQDWIWDYMVGVPAVASQVMISPEPVNFGPNIGTGPAWWVGALVLVGYGILAGTVGTLITRKRDIS